MNTGTDEKKLVSSVLQYTGCPFRYCYKYPMVLDLHVSPTSPHSAVEEPFT